MKTEIFLALLVATSAAFASPRVDQSSVTMSQDVSGKMTIGYVLADEPAIVTIDIQTNAGENAWVSIGESNIRGFAGDVNRLLQPDVAPRTATWQPGIQWGRADVSGGNLRAVVNAWSTNNPPDVAVFSLTVPSNVMFYTSLAALPLDPTDDLYKTDRIVMRRCRAAGLRWNRGAPFGEPQRREGSDQHYEDPFVCTISEDYYLGIFELTKYQYDVIYGRRPYYDTKADGRKPEIGHTWEAFRGSGADYDWPTKGHAVSPTSCLGRLRALTGYAFDLPTAAQWEFACRAGTTTAFSNGTNDGYNVPEIAWTVENTSVLHEVGLLKANPWGFYDMHGNASEWTLDYMTNYPVRHDCENGPDAAPMDHSYMASGGFRVIRGGGFQQSGIFARSGCVSDWSPPNFYSDHGKQIGVRVCMPAVATH